MGSVLIDGYLWRSNTVYCHDLSFQTIKAPKVAAPHITICNYICKAFDTWHWPFTPKLREISFYCSLIQTWAIIGIDLLRTLNCDFAFCRQNQQWSFLGYKWHICWDENNSFIYKYYGKHCLWPWLLALWPAQVNSSYPESSSYHLQTHL